MSKKNNVIVQALRRQPQLRSVATICGLLLAVFGIMCMLSDTYASTRNITNLLVQCVPLAIVSLGQTLVIISGGIDLSLGSTISLTTVIAAKLMDTSSPLQLAFAVLTLFLAAGLIGFINGLGVNYCKVPPMITTLCTSTVINGVALLIMPVAGGRVNKEFASFLMSKWTIASMPLVLLLMMFLLVRHVLYQTRTGTEFYAIGQNRAISASMGINVKRSSVKAYILAALCAAMTGLVLASRMRMGDPVVGTLYSMDSITAAAIGGVSMAGGIGLLSGSIAGAFLVGMLANAMNMLGVNQFYQYVLKGSLLVIAMIIYSLSNLLEVRRHEK